MLVEPVFGLDQGFDGFDEQDLNRSKRAVRGRVVVMYAEGKSGWSALW